jgi:hypothetical protein
MMRYIINLIHLPGLLFALARDIKIQKCFIRRVLSHDIALSKANNDNTLNEHDFLKIERYYGLAVPTVLGEAFCVLRGRAMTSKERLAISCAGALTGLFDDFFDKRNLPENRILQFITNPYEVVCDNSNEALFISFYKKTLENCLSPELLKGYALKVFDAQKMSKKQCCDDITFSEIEDVTFLKGGVSLQFYRSVFGETHNEAEDKMLYYAGGLGQLENDVFDVWKDYNEGIKTLPTTTRKIAEIRLLYLYTYQRVASLLSKTTYCRKSKKRFLRLFALVVSRGMVCLDQLENLQESTGGEFKLQAYRQKQLICDMEKPINMLRSFYYYTKLSQVVQL